MSGGARMELASRATLAAGTLIVLTLLLHRFESPPPPPSPSHSASPALPLRAAEPPTLQQQPAALRGAGNGTMLRFWHVTDWHLNLFHRADGDVRDMCRSATGDRARWPGPLGHFNCDPSRAVAQMAVRRKAEACASSLQS